MLFEWFIANLWDEDLARDPETLEIFDIKDSGTTRTFFDKVRMEQDQTVLGMLTHFLERGLLSGEVYTSPDINPRDIISTKWTQLKDNRPSIMFDAAVNMETHVMSFDVSNEPISLHFYEVQESDSLKSNKILKSRRTMQVKKDVPNAPANSRHLLSGWARGRNGVMLSGKAFKRLLEFFNHKWVRTSEDGIEEPVADDKDPTASKCSRHF